MAGHRRISPSKRDSISGKQIPQVKFWVVMETFIGDTVLRQEECVFDNKAKSFCKHPAKIDPSRIWKAMNANSKLSGLLLEQFQSEASEKVAKPNDRLAVLCLSVRSKKALSLAGITDIAQVEARIDADLLKLKGFGPTCLFELRTRIEDYRRAKGL